MRKIAILQLCRALSMDDPQLFAFFDRAISHVLGIREGLPMSRTEALIARAEALGIENYAWVIRPDLSQEEICIQK